MIHNVLLCFHITTTKDFCIVELSTRGRVTETSEKIHMQCTEIYILFD